MPVTRQALENPAALGLYIDKLQRLEDLLQGYIRDGKRQAIVIRAARRGVPIFEGCYGTNTKPGGVKPDTIFPVASITKPVISTLLMILQEEGRVDLNAPLFRYFPEFNEGGREEICLWHLLTHTSGLKDEEIWPFERSYVKNELGLAAPDEETATHDDWVAFENQIAAKMGVEPDPTGRDRMRDTSYLISLKAPINRPPRSYMTYCNRGYQLLKMLVDALTDEPIDQFAQRVLFGPLNMPDTHWRTPKEKWDRILGRGETCEGYPWINTEENYLNESGSGGLKSTVGDISRLAAMVMNGGELDGVRILNRRSVREMLSDHNAGVPAINDPAFAIWGLGWNLRRNKKDDSGMLRSPLAFDHGGWAGTKIIADPEEDLTLAIFTADYKPDVCFYQIYAPIVSVLYSSFE